MTKRLVSMLKSKQANNKYGWIKQIKFQNHDVNNFCINKVRKYACLSDLLLPYKSKQKTSYAMRIRSNHNP